MKLKSPAAALLFLALCVFAPAASAQDKRGPSTPEERAKVVQIARALESEPLHENAKKAREGLFYWIVNVPDITVTLCTDYLSGLYKDKKNYSSELAMQMTFSSVAFIIENPAQAQDDVAVQKAGVEGTLRAYEAILKEKPKAKWPFLDDLIQRRDKGTLEEYVREISTTKCKAKK